MTVVSLREYFFVIVGSVVLWLALTAVLFPWAGQARTLITIGLTTTPGIIIWNTLLNVTNATFLNVDSPVLGLSAQDVGSGIGAFLRDGTRVAACHGPTVVVRSGPRSLRGSRARDRSG
jgi:hypothetical protein